MRLTEYLQRIGVRGPVDADRTTLDRIHRAHRETFLFENLTIQTGGRVSVGLDDLERKFLDEGRGGYCFEHNTLFAAALRDLGFATRTLLGRVRRGPPERWCRTHMVLRVPNSELRTRKLELGTAESATRSRNPEPEAWLADVGFGGLGLLEPIELRDGARAVQGGFEYALRREDQLWVLSATDASGLSTDLYEFTADPQTPWDVEVANHFTATHPESVFRRSLTIQKSSRDERVILRNDIVERYRGGVRTETRIDRAQLAPVARELFGIDLPRGPFVFEGALSCRVEL